MLLISRLIICTVLAFAMPIGFSAGSDGCPLCGCKAGHCAYGIPSHLACSNASPTEKQAIEQRVSALEKAVQSARESNTAQCNELVQMVAQSYGYQGLNGYDANGIIRRLMSDSSAKDGWIFVASDTAEKGAPVMMGFKEASQYANVGYLVIGVIHKGIRNLANPGHDRNGNPIRPFGHGHTFVVLPNDLDNNGVRGPSKAWDDLNIANAGGSRDDGRAQVTTATRALYEFERPLVTFYVLPKR